MRVVAGKYRGKNLKSPKDDKIRPTTTRIKETLFNVLQGYVSDSTVLDLFAGSGALGIECISRGAKDVTFVDKSHDAVQLINQNLVGIRERCQVVNNDFQMALRHAYTANIKYDLIFLDPPYATNLAEIAIDTIIEYDLLSDDGIIVFEHGEEKSYEMPNKAYKQRTKKMGTVVAEFISKKKVALMAGSFDPFTRGHEGVLDECLEQFDEVWVACLINPDKQYTFNDAQRLKMVERVCELKKGAHAIFSKGMTVDVAREVGAQTLVRGVRDDNDLQYEMDMAKFNKDHGFDTKFVTLDCFKNISSTLVKQQIANGDFRNVPSSVAPLLQSKEFLELQ